MVRNLVMLAEWDESPLWAEGDSVPLDLLPLSDHLKAELEAWVTEYEHLVETEPEEPDEAQLKVEAALDERGRELARLVAQELGPTFRVTYRGLDDRGTRPCRGPKGRRLRRLGPTCATCGVGARSRARAL